MHLPGDISRLAAVLALVLVEQRILVRKRISHAECLDSQYQDVSVFVLALLEGLSRPVV